MDLINKYIEEYPTFNGIERRIRLIAIIEKEREHLYDFIKTIIETKPKYGYVLSYLVSFLTEEEVGKLVPLVMKKMNLSKCEASEDFVQQVMFQFVHFLHPYIDQLIYLAEEKDYCFYYGYLRGSNYLEKLKEQTETKKEIEKEKDRNWHIFNKLLEIRSIEAIKYAVYLARKYRIFDNRPRQEISFEEYLNVYTNLSGVEVINDDYIPLLPKKSWHLCFPKGHFDAINHVKPYHPTYEASNPEYEFSFGGMIETQKDYNLYHIITLEGSILSEIGVTELNKLILAFDLDRETDNFFKHDNEGNPSFCGKFFNDKIGEICPILKTKVQLERTSERWSCQDWMFSNSNQNLNKIGGFPSFVEGYFPSCPKTGEKMTFLMQLDNIRTTSEYPYPMAEGVFYIFWSDKAKISTILYEQT